MGYKVEVWETLAFHVPPTETVVTLADLTSLLPTKNDNLSSVLHNKPRIICIAATIITARTALVNERFGSRVHCSLSHHVILKGAGAKLGSSSQAA